MAAKAKVRGVVAKASTKLLKGNQFHPCKHDWAAVEKAASDLDAHLTAAGPNGYPEQPLLNWFGESTERICLFAHALGVINPTHIARELILGDMRTDFALLTVPSQNKAKPRLLLVECQGALDKSLFEAGNRKLNYWGLDFLDGFSQLVDWKTSDYHNIQSQEIANLIAGNPRPMETSYMLIAGLNRFAQDNVSQRRMKWWADHVNLGNNFAVKTFDDVASEAGEWVAQTKRVQPALQAAQAGAKKP